MATKAEPVRIGPFTGGLNTYSDPSAVADEDAVDLINFEVDLDGSLVSRPPFVATARGIDQFNNRILGVYTTAAGTTFIIFATGASSTGVYNVNAGTFDWITTTFRATAVVQYQNKAWLIAPPGSVNPGGNWDGTVFTGVPAMAKGTTAVVYKERIFIGTGAGDAANPSRVIFSGPANPTSWTGTDFFDVNNGDGQPLVKLINAGGSIAIFKTDSTYIYSYESTPAKGQVQNLSSTVGIDGPDCLTESENILYVMSGGDAYSISNWTWEQLNVKVPFEYLNNNTGATRGNFCVSDIGNRIIFRYYDTLYVFGTKTRTWTKWLTVLTPDKFFKSPITNATTGINTYYAGNYLNSSVDLNAQRLFTFEELYTSARTETFTCTVKSKVYSMNVPYSFKRLMWWGIDLLARSRVEVIVTPVKYGRAVRWNEVTALNKTWAQMANSTWAAPLDISIEVVDESTLNNPTNTRMFVKFLKSLRFRQVQFTIRSTINGSTTQGPLKIYSVTAFVINKQGVPAKIS